MKLRHFLSVGLLCLSVTLSGSALADPQTDFIKSGQTTLTDLLRQPASADRDQKLTKTMGDLVDYPELVRRCFKEDWLAKLNDAQRAEVSDLLKQLVQKNYRKNLKRTLDYTVTYAAPQPVAGTTDIRVRSSAQSKANAREAPVQVDYVVAGPPYKIVDIITEGSSLTNTYYGQFHKMLAPDGQGYAHLVSKLKEKLAKPD